MHVSIFMINLLVFRIHFFFQLCFFPVKMDVSTAPRLHSEEFCDYFANSVLVGRNSAVEAGNTVVDA